MRRLNKVFAFFGTHSKGRAKKVNKKGSVMSSTEQSGEAIKAKTPKAAQPPMTAAEEAWDLVKTVFIAVAIALVLRIVIFQPFNIPSGSMKPTLLVGDFLVVSKPTFGYSKASLVYPLTRIPAEGRILQFAEPKRGDVLVFKNRKDGNKDYIKRLIGMPGDTVQMLGGVLHINGKPVQKELTTRRMFAATGAGRRPIAKRWIRARATSCRNAMAMTARSTTPRPMLCRPDIISSWATIATSPRTAAS